MLFMGVLFISVAVMSLLNKESLTNEAESSAETLKNLDEVILESEMASNPLDVPLIQQMPELARGCEVTSLAMILQYEGIDVDKMELAERIAYEPFIENGLRGNMNQGFVGNMETFAESGLGVYVEPIIEMASLYIDDSDIINLTGQSTEQLYQYLEFGSPVWMLTNARFMYLPFEQFRTWQTAEGSMLVTYLLHSVVLTGYDEQYVYVNDPLQSEKNFAVNRKSFEEAWIQMGRQAFCISEEKLFLP